MKILVTGAAGFIGFHLINRLILEGYEIVGIDNLNEYYDINLKLDRLSNAGIEKTQINNFNLITSTKSSSYNFIKLNLEDKKQLEILFKKQNFDIVCNLAAQAGVRYSLTNPDEYINANIVGFFNILDISSKFKIKHFIYASSSSVYGLNKTLPFSTKLNVDQPISLYAATKKTNELFAHAYSNLYNIPTTGLRFFTVYGPWGRPDMAPFIFTKSIIEGKTLNVYNNGEMLRDFTYIDDVIESIIRLLPIPPNSTEDIDNLNFDKTTAPYKIFNIGNSKPIKLMNFINLIETELNKKAKINFLPLQQGDMISTYADVEDLQKSINFLPNTSIKDGVKNFIDWYIDYFKINN